MADKRFWRLILFINLSILIFGFIKHDWMISMGALVLSIIIKKKGLVYLFPLTSQSHKKEKINSLKERI